MNILMWLIIGFITGLVIAAIVSVILKGGSSKESEQARHNTSANLAKAEVKNAVLEDKLRQAGVDASIMRVNLEADYLKQLDAAKASYREQLAILESTNRELVAAMADALVEAEERETDEDLEEEILTADSETIGNELDEGDIHLEDLIVINDAEGIPEESKSLDGIAASGALIAAALVIGDEEDADLEEVDTLLAIDTESQAEPLGIEEIDEPTFSNVEAVDDEIRVDDDELVGEETTNNDVDVYTEEAETEDAVAAEENLFETDHEPPAGSLAALAVGAAAIGSAAGRESDVDEHDAVLVGLESELPEQSAAVDSAGESPTSDVPDQDAGIDIESELVDDDLVVIAAETQDQMLEEGDNEQDIIIADDEESKGSGFGNVGMTAVGVAAISALAVDEGDHQGEDGDLEAAGAEELQSEESEADPNDENSAVSLDEADVEPAVPEWPDDNSVWQGEYFNNKKLEGEPVFVRKDAKIQFDWEYGSPSPEIEVDNFSVRWTRKAEFPPGLYRFTVTSDDGARLWVNERLVISAWYDHSQMTFRREMELPGGPVNLRLEYYENDMTALIECSWERIG